VRETRRVRASYVLTEEDILEKTRFPDSIGIDSNRQNPKGPRHSPDGMEGSAQDVENRELVASLFTYEIPYRCLLPESVEGLVVAGRAISADHDADGYTRNQPACMVTGQAAGVAASLSVQHDVEPRNLDIKMLQRSLRSLGTKIHRSELN
jgi:hypothetical protein